MFRFTIRDTLLVILAIATGLGWWFDHVRGYHARKTASLERGIEAVLAYVKANAGRNCIFVDAIDNQVYGDYPAAQYVISSEEIRIRPEIAAAMDKDDHIFGRRQSPDNKEAPSPEKAGAGVSRNRYNQESD
jgi:hypothetical protein